MIFISQGWLSVYFKGTEQKRIYTSMQCLIFLFNTKYPFFGRDNAMDNFNDALKHAKNAKAVREELMGDNAYMSSHCIMVVGVNGPETLYNVPYHDMSDQHLENAKEQCEKEGFTFLTLNTTQSRDITSLHKLIIKRAMELRNIPTGFVYQQTKLPRESACMLS
jgi:hypothetical protein